MPEKLISWSWTDEAEYRSVIDRLKTDPRNRTLYLPSSPDAPMFGLISHRLLRVLDRMPDPVAIELEGLDKIFLKRAEEFLSAYAGVNLDEVLLIEPSHYPLRDKNGCQVRCPVVHFWCGGIVGVTARAEWPLMESYYVDRILLQTELINRCDSEE